MENTKSKLSMRSKILYFIASVIMVLIIIAYILYYIPAETVFQVITNFSWGWIILLFIDLTFCMILRGIRMKTTLISSKKDVSFKNCLFSIFGNYCINTVSPARLGDVYNAYALYKSDNIRPGHSIAAVLISRILDIAFLLIFALFTFFYHIFFGGVISPFSQGIFPYIESGIILVACLIGMILIITVFKEKFVFLITKIIKIFPSIKKMEVADKVQDITKECVDYIDILFKDTKKLLKILLQSFFIILLDTLTIFFLTRAINFTPSSPRVLANNFYHDMQIHLTILATSTALLSLSFIILPGGIGQYEFAGAFVLENIAGMALLPWAATGLLLMFIEHLLVRAPYFLGLGLISLYYLGKKFPRVSTKDVTTEREEFKKPKKVTIIIPCYNEEDNITECVNRVPNLEYDYEIIVVDDGSKDKTAQVAKKINRKELTVLRYKKNRGKGHACRIGTKYATGDVIIICDADMATQPEEIPLVLKPIIKGTADFVNGSRLIYPREKGAMKKLHVLGNYVFALIFSIILGLKVTDTLCGFKAFRKEKMKGFLKEDSWPDFEMLLQVKKKKMRIVEVPIHYKSRKAGRSKMKTFKHGYNMIRMLLRSLG